MEKQEYIDEIRTEYLDINQVLNEKSIRWWCASKARSYNRVHEKGGLSRQVVVNLIGNTTTKKGLRIYAELDENIYQKGMKISDEQLAEVNLNKDEFHGNWNYIIKPISNK